VKNAILAILVSSSTILAQGSYHGQFGIERARNVEKYAAIQYHHDLGYWVRPYAGASLIARKNMMNLADYIYIGEVGVSIRVENSSGWFASVHQGVAYASKTDRFFGTQLQYPTGASFGLVSSHGRSIGLFYKHYSNGRVGNNLGRDFFGLEFGF